MAAEANFRADFGKIGLQFGKKCDLESNFVDKVTVFAVAGGLFAVMMGSKYKKSLFWSPYSLLQFENEFVQRNKMDSKIERMMIWSPFLRVLSDFSIFDACLNLVWIF